MLTAKEVALRYQITQDVVYKMAKAGEIPPPVRIGSRLLRWPASSLSIEAIEKWNAERQKKLTIVH